MFKHLVYLVAIAFSLACAPTIKVREDIFQSQPLWESSLIRDDSAHSSNGSDDPTGFGLSALEEQVLGQSFSPTGAIRANAKNVSTLFSATDQNPIPKELAALSVTKAIVESASGACRGAEVPNRKLSHRDFRKFGEAILRLTLDPYQDPAAGSMEEELRLKKLMTFIQTGKISWEGLAWSYFTAYYKGKFVDRTGGTLSKPSIGMKIPNETITSAITVGLESIYDYALLSCGLRNPIVFKTKKDPTRPIPETDVKFQTKDGNVPTLVGVLLRAVSNGKSSDDEDELKIVRIPFVLEQLQTKDNAIGITAKKLKWIRFLSGAASDASGTVADLLIRSFGGTGGAFVVFGKVSIGDNDTLAKIIQTLIDVTARRSTEAAVADRFYGVHKSTSQTSGVSLDSEGRLQHLLGF